MHTSKSIHVSTNFKSTMFIYYLQYNVYILLASRHVLNVEYMSSRHRVDVEYLQEKKSRHFNESEVICRLI